jgi:hypothetical protein
MVICGQMVLVGKVFLGLDGKGLGVVVIGAEEMVDVAM